MFDYLFEDAQKKDIRIKTIIRENKYVVCEKDNKTTRVSEQGQPQPSKFGFSNCGKHNLSTSNKTVHYTSADIEINVVDNNFCNG
jgi:hypothetical protein